MMTKPKLIDNRNGNTLAQALSEALGVNSGCNNLEKPGDPPPDELRIATAFFTPSGFIRIADHIQPIPMVRLLLGADLATHAFESIDGIPGEPQTKTEALLETGLTRMLDKLSWEIDRLPFTRSNDKALRKLITALCVGNIEVRRYEKAFLHAKTYIFNSITSGRPPGIITGSSNLTKAGLISNLELNLGCHDPSIIEQATQWFDDLWEEANPYDLTSMFEEVLRLREPWEIFIRVLWQFHGNEIKEEPQQSDGLPLTNFQQHGVARALRLIRENKGAIVADEVGLGKTFIAGEVLRVYHKKRQRALLICPAALRDSTWKKFQNRFQFDLSFECLSFDQLARDKQLGNAFRPDADQEYLQRDLSEYQLVVVDEAHNYRNPSKSHRSEVLQTLLTGRPRRDVLLLTATPVNNSLWDLYHLVRFFIRQDSHFADRGILSIRERFKDAMRQNPSDLSPDTLYPIIDATTVKRTREFIKKHYSDDRITGSDGELHPIVFPKPHAISVRYNLDEILPGFFDRLEVALDPDGADSITFTRYAPDIYLKKSDSNAEENQRANATIGLLRSGLLKRFESSAHAFYKTATKMVDQHDSFLKALDHGYVVTTDFMKELSADDTNVFEEVLEGTKHRRDADTYKINQLRSAVQQDRNLLQELADQAKTITPKHDPKLNALINELTKIAYQATSEATDIADERQKRKVLVFSFFEDTLEWILKFIRDTIGTHSEQLAVYHGRITSVSGSDNDASRQRALHGFAPITMGALQESGNDLYDLLISTDVLAEGVNLQQCRHIINFDMPWNPMRLVQRHGRIDRIDSPHKKVFMRTIFPADQLDRLLNLEQRILTKLAMAAASVGVTAPIEKAAHGTQIFSETRSEITKLLAEDPSLYERGSTASAAQTGEEYRQILRKVLDQLPNTITCMPWKSGSAMIKKGTHRGVFFCAVVNTRTYLRFVKADMTWDVSTEKGAILDEIGTCLKLIECKPDTPIWKIGELQDRIYDFWSAARDNIYDAWMYETDPANLQPEVQQINHRVAEFIRANQPIDMSEEQITQAIEIVESPWPRREEIMLRNWFSDNEKTRVELSRFLVTEILGTGLEKATPPDPLPPIVHEDINLLCWMAIENVAERQDTILGITTP